jgi:hypothetical protein
VSHPALSIQDHSPDPPRYDASAHPLRRSVVYRSHTMNPIRPNKPAIITSMSCCKNSKR